MKKTILISLIVAIFSCMSVFAAPSNYEYGRFLHGRYVQGPFTMEGTITNNFTFHNDGKYTAGGSSECVYKGEKSFKIDCTSSNGACILEQGIYANNDMLKNCVYFEAYINGFSGSKPSTVGFGRRYTLDGQYVGSNVSPMTINWGTPDENGWRKVSGLAQPSYGGTEYDEVAFSISYSNDGTVNDGIEALYIDDFSLRLAPTSIRIDDVTSSKKSFPLSKLRVYGYDMFGEKTLINSTDIIKYTVIGGSGYVDVNNNLNYVGNADGDVTLSAEYLGVTTTFKVSFTPEIIASVSGKSDTNSYTASIINGSNNVAKATLIVCLYDGMRLSDIKIYDKKIAANTSDVIVSQDYDVPFYVKNPAFSAYCFVE